MTTYLALAITGGALIVLGDEVQDGIAHVMRSIKSWAAADGRATAVAISIAALLVGAMVVVAFGVYSLLKGYLPYCLPETPDELPLSMTVISSALGLGLHCADGKKKAVVAVLAVLFMLTFGIVAFIPSAEMMDGESGYQPYAAASIVWLCSASELMVAYVAFSTAGSAIGYLWLVPVGIVLLPIYIVAWLLSGIKSKVLEWVRWLFTGRRDNPEGLWRLFDEKQSVSEVVDEERDKTVKRGFILVMFWTRFWQFLTSFFSGLPNARRSTDTASESLHEKCVEVKRHANGKCKELVSLVVVLVGLSAADAQGRSVFTLVDGTGSFAHTEQAREHIADYIVPQLGPGDDFWLAMLGSFDNQLPAVTASFPNSIGIELAGWKSLFEWKQSKKELEGLWGRTDVLRKTLEVDVEEAIRRQKGGTTQLHTWLAYGSALLASSQGEKWLLVYSDMHEEDGQISTRLPPDHVDNFAGVNVRILHVPFDSDWVAVKESWEEWFRKAGVESFEIYPVGVSLNLEDAIPRSSVPRELPRFGVQ